MIMKRYLSALCITAALCALSATASAQSYRGMNVLSSATPQDITDLETLLHPNVVRYTLSWGTAADTATKEQYFAWLNSALDNFDANILPIFVANGTGVILNLGTAPGGWYSVSPPFPQMRVFAQAWAQEAFKEVWQLLANRYKNNSAIKAFHLLSEPAIGSAPGAGLLGWYPLQIEVAKMVRAIDKTHPIVLTSQYSWPDRLSKIKAPRSLGKVWYAIHVYYPVSFLRQGVERASYKTTYPTKKLGRAQLRKYLAKSISFATAKRAKLYVAEFATTRFGPTGSSVRYLKDIIDIFNKLRWHWTFHAWRESDAWSVEHPALEDTDPSVPTARARLLKKYFGR